MREEDKFNQIWIIVIPQCVSKISEYPGSGVETTRLNLGRIHPLCSPSIHVALPIHQYGYFFFVPSGNIDNCLRLFGTSNT